MTLRPNMDHRRANTNEERRNTGISSESRAIIPGLPEDVAFCILARLPRSLQLRRRLICHAWKDAMETARMGSLRKALHTSEEWPVFISARACGFTSDQFLFPIVDPLERRCCNIPLPKELEQHNLPHGGLYREVIGAIGSDVLIACQSIPASEEGAELRQGVYSFSGLSMKWADSKYASLPSSLSFNFNYGHASAADVDGGFLYVAGGFSGGRSIQGFVRLDTKARMWETLPDPRVKREHAVGFVLQGLFYLIGGWSDLTPTTRWQVQNSGEIWDPVSRQWTFIPELWPSKIFGSSFEKSRVVALKDRLYALRRLFMTDVLMYYESVSKSWTSLGCVPLDASSHYHMHELHKVCLLAMGEELWVIDRSSRAGVATKPPFSRPISWKTLPCTYERAFPIHGDYKVAAIHV